MRSNDNKKEEKWEKIRCATYFDQGDIFHNSKLVFISHIGFIQFIDDSHETALDIFHNTMKVIENHQLNI